MTLNPLGPPLHTHPPHPPTLCTLAHPHLDFLAGLHLDPPEFDMRWARDEAELVMFNAVADLLKKTGLKPRQVDVLGE